MPTRFARSAAFALFLVLSCGKKPIVEVYEAPPEPPKPLVENVPSLLRVRGPITPGSAIQVRNMGGSKMVLFHAFSRVEMEPEVPKLPELIQLGRGRDLEWVEANAVRGEQATSCVLSQIDVQSETREGATTLEVIAWGWEKPSETHCQAFFKLAQRDGFGVNVRNVPVTRSAPVKQVEIVIDPELE